jgi:hypothetical protein
MHQYNVGVPFEMIAIDVAGRPANTVPPDRYGLFYEVPGNLRHSQSRGFDSGGSASYELLLRIRNTLRST